jgi:hypothetical protein
MLWQPAAGVGRQGWETVAAPLVESQWQILNGSWNGILSDVTGIQIYPFYSPSEFGRVAGVDNITVVPEPSSFVLLGMAGLCVLLAGLRRCHRLSGDCTECRDALRFQIQHDCHGIGESRRSASLVC